MRYIESSSSFQDVDVGDIDTLRCCDELVPLVNPRTPPNGQSAQETWSCAWSQDNTCFAWSCGNNFVQLIPWDAQTGHLSKEAKDYNKRCRLMYQSGERHTASVRLVPVVESPTEQEYDIHLQQDQITKTPARVPLTINCGVRVWSVGFGSGSSPANTKSTWKRFNFDRVLLLVTGLQNGKIKTWDCSTGNLLIELIDHKDIVRDLHFAPNGSLLVVSASRDGTMKVWDLNDDGNMCETLRGKSPMLHGCRWSPDGGKLACVGSNRTVTVFDVKNRYSGQQLKGHHHDVSCCDFSPDGALLATSCYDSRVIIWDPHTGEALLELGHLFPKPRLIYAGGANDHYVRHVSFSNDGLQLASVCDDEYVRVWDLQDPANPVAVAKQHSPLCCAFTPNGHSLAVGDRSGAVTFYRTPNKVANLQHLARQTVRKIVVATSQVDNLHLPVRLQDYLKYHTI